jgi:predicted DCC family thiol-disulfide oxidoreductase YuxK
MAPHYHQLPCAPTFVFYDGECATCHFVVKFLLRRSHRERFRFVALQNLAGTELEERIRQDLKLDLTSSLIVWKNGELWARAAAVSAIVSELGWPWRLFLLFRLLPLGLSDFFYNLYASRRYQIAGRARDKDICAVLPREQRALFPAEWTEAKLVFPPGPDVFLSAQWRNLILVNFEVPSSILQEFLPYGVEVDSWNNQTLVSLVGFSFAGTSVKGMTLPWAADFEEVNLRFYVKRRVQEQGTWVERRAVVFVREIVPFKIIAATANLFYGERYRSLIMNHETLQLENQKKVTYHWGDQDGSCSIEALLNGDPKPLEDGSLAEFITEHYFGYAKKGPRASTEYQVEHPRWRVWNDVKVKIQGNFARFYPDVFRPYLERPHSMMVAEGSPVRVMQGQKIP